MRPRSLIQGLLILALLVAAPACSTHRLPKEMSEGNLKQMRDQLASGDKILSFAPVEGTDLKHAQVFGVVDAPIERVWRVVTDYDHYDEFMTLVEESRVKWTRGNVAKFEMVFGLTGVPQPRYNITVAMVHYPHKYRIEWVYIEGDIIDTFGSWTLKPFGEDRTEVIYSMFMDLSGTLVGPFAQLGSGMALPAAIEALRDQVEEPRYDDLEVPEYARMEQRRPTLIDREFAAFD